MFITLSGAKTSIVALLLEAAVGGEWASYCKFIDISRGRFREMKLDESVRADDLTK